MSSSKKKASPLLKRRITTFVISAFFLVATVFLSVFFLFFCRIQSVSVENCVYSSEDNIISSANIKIGSHSYSINKNKIAESIKAQNPYVSAVRIKRTSPRSVKIILTEETPYFYTVYGEKCLVLSKTLRLLSEYEKDADISFLTANKIFLPQIKEAELGKNVVFDNISDGQRAMEAISLIFASELAENITLSDVSEKFDIRFTYKNKYDIRFGSFKNISENLTLVINTVEYLEDHANGYQYVKGIIHASVPGETSFEATGTITP